MSKTEYVWVEGRYIGDKAKYIKGMSDAGVGYFELEYGFEKQKPFIKAAFPYVLDNDGIPEHLDEITGFTQKCKLEKKRCQRMGVHSSHKADNVITKCKVCGLS